MSWANAHICGHLFKLIPSLGKCSFWLTLTMKKIKKWKKHYYLPHMSVPNEKISLNWWARAPSCHNRVLELWH